MSLKFELIAAASENMGIGINGRLPWRLKNETIYFSRLTTKTKDPQKKNVVLMGRRTWEGLPMKYRPLNGRINVVLTSRELDLGDQAIVCKSLSDVVDKLTQSPLREQIERVWAIGGRDVYQATMVSSCFHRLYLTEIKEHFECDTFFPPIGENLRLVKDPEVPEGIQEENGLKYEFKVYEKP